MSVIEHSKLSLLNELPGYITIHNFDSTLAFVNNSTAKLLGFKNSEQAIGCHFENMPCKASEIADIFTAQDQAVIKNAKSIKVVGLSCYANNDWRLVVGEKKLLHDEKQKPVGVICHFNDYTDTGVLNISRYLVDSYKYTLGSPVGEQLYFTTTNLAKDIYQFTQKELECIFYLIHGFSCAYVAAKMNLSKRTIESHVANIKEKLSCDSKSMMIEKLISLGYLNIIPDIILNKNF